MIAIRSFSTVSQNVPNGSFENWVFNISGMPEPEGWKTQNDREMVFVESAEGQSGNFSACLNVVWDRMKQEYAGGYLTSATLFAVEEKYSGLTGYISGNSNNSDTLLISISLYSDDQKIANGCIAITSASSNWQQFNIKINYEQNIKPDKAGISISIIPAKGFHYQTVYCLDDLNLNCGQEPRK